MATLFLLSCQTSEEEIGRAAMIQAQQPRQKGTGTRVWTGLAARDLKELDPVLSYPSSILDQQWAIAANLAHTKAIITAKEVLMHFCVIRRLLGYLCLLKCPDKLASVKVDG
ncbi:hypothetical protein NL676_014292 [Syzygium grande]|nr:hypothetical protein NL676_014292 [Syzygium grande]